MTQSIWVNQGRNPNDDLAEWLQGGGNGLGISKISWFNKQVPDNYGNAYSGYWLVEYDG